MLTVSKLAYRCGLSRSTLLYYESIGLMKPALRSIGNYRCYGEKDITRLQHICAYRDSGLKLEDIRALLDGARTDAARVLQRRLSELNGEIETLRGHQRAILRLLQNRSFRRTKVISKDKWVEIMRATGFTEDDMHRWHAQFEKMAPNEHQEFLEFLHIQPDEIKSIRDWSRKGK
jgi:DNA-binding transcriptional MerR regulator